MIKKFAKNKKITLLYYPSNRHHLAANVKSFASFAIVNFATSANIRDESKNEILIFIAEIREWENFAIEVSELMKNRILNEPWPQLKRIRFLIEVNNLWLFLSEISNIQQQKKDIE